MAQRARLKAHWEAKGLRGRSMLRPEIKHRVTGPEMVAQLKLLAEVTSDARFEEALEALTDCEVIDGHGNWRRDMLDVCRTFEMDDIRDHIFLAVESRVERGCPIKRACAEVVVAGSLRGHSFEAVCKEVERLWRGYRDEGRNTETVKHEVKRRDDFIRIVSKVRQERAAAQARSAGTEADPEVSGTEPC